MHPKDSTINIQPNLKKESKSNKYKYGSCLILVVYDENNDLVDWIMRAVF